MSRYFRFLLIAALVLMGSHLASAQSTTDGAIGGIIKDPQGAVVANATVSVRNEETNKESTATTDNEGRFRVVQLQPGNYTVSVNAQGFSAFSQQKIVVEVGRVTPLEIPLTITGSQETVVVTSEAPVINTSQQDFSTNINQTSINELPINGRRWSNFALLTPGSAPDGTFGLISFRGVSGLLNNNTIDGGDNNQAFFSEERGRSRISYVISQAAVREFQVNTSNYSAEYGRAAGGVVNAVTKSGTNEFHGSGFYYQRNNRWGARNPLATRQVPLTGGGFGVEGIKPKDVRHQFGATIGGPIVKEKLFFFFSYDEQRRNFPGLSVFSQADFLNRADRALLTTARGKTLTGTGRTGSLASGKGLTDAQVDNALNFLASLSGEVPRRGDQRIFLPKIDWRVNNNNTFTATYNRLRWNAPAGVQSQATNTRARDNFGNDYVNVDSLTLRLQSTLSPTALNEFRFQYGRDFEYQFSQPALAGEPTTANGRSPQVFITNGFSFGVPEFLERASYPDERRFQYADTFTLTHGSHTLKFGGDINRVSDKINNIRFGSGEFNYTGGLNAAGFYGGLNDFIIDYANFISPGSIAANTPCYTSTRTVGRCYGGNFNQGFGVPGLTFSTTDLNLFVQDDYRASSKLTLNFGLRYEYQKNPSAINVNSALPQTGNIPNDKNNFGPRIGFAYDLQGNGKTSIRGGYGIYYGRIINSTIYNALINTGVGVDRAQRQVTLTASSAAAPTFPNLLSAGTPVPSAVQYFASDFANPLINQYDFIVERQIARNTAVSFSYIGSLGRYLPIFIDTNLSRPTSSRAFTVTGGPFDGQSVVVPVFPTTRPNTNYTQITEIRSGVNSEYNALVLQANRRFTDGLQFQTSYTYSSSRDTGQTSTTFTTGNVPLDVFNLGLETGVSNFDQPHKFVASVVWTPDFFGSQGDSRVGRAVFNGFTIAPVFYAFSGRPYTAGVSVTGAGGPGGVNQSGGANRFPLLGRNTYRQPKIVNFDLRVSRRFNLGEARNIEVLAEGFNIFNRTQVTGVNSTLYTQNFGNNTFTYNAPFGSTNEAGATLFRERQVQLAVRFEF